MTPDESSYCQYSSYWPISNNSELIFLSSMTDFLLLAFRIPYNSFFTPCKYLFRALSWFLLLSKLTLLLPALSSQCSSISIHPFLVTAFSLTALNTMYMPMTTKLLSIAQASLLNSIWQIQLAGHYLHLDVLKTSKLLCPKLYSDRPLQLSKHSFVPHRQQLHFNGCSGPSELTSEISTIVKPLRFTALTLCPTNGNCLLCDWLKHILNVLKYTIYLPCVEKRMDQDICQSDLQILHLIFSILPEKNFFWISRTVNNTLSEIWKDLHS